jgi:hypothetical protein
LPIDRAAKRRFNWQPPGCKVGLDAAGRVLQEAASGPRWVSAICRADGPRLRPGRGETVYCRGYLGNLIPVSSGVFTTGKAAVCKHLIQKAIVVGLEAAMNKLRNTDQKTSNRRVTIMNGLKDKLVLGLVMLLGSVGSAYAQQDVPPGANQLPEPGLWALLAIGGVAYWLTRRNK